jgi:acetyltransferase EpsM
MFATLDHNLKAQPSIEVGKIAPVIPVMILGTGDFAVEVADLILDTPTLRLDGFVENLDITRCEKQLLGKSIFWINDISELIETHKMICAIGSTKRSEYVAQVIQMGCQFATLIHPTARVSRLAQIGCGSIVSAGVQIAAETKIGEHVIVNRGAMIGHHANIDNFVTISPGANIGGRTKIGKQAYIAMSSVILNDIQIGQQSIVGAGSIVTKDVPERVQVLGAPARITKTLDEPR